ncbi:MAG: hypothetical protein M1834_009073 [Cirrosporium novae-zelandiae]|nr:MAG: hypothetical protein M1834_009073 [Cirrosporium novae-zelandiae]
MTMVAENQQRQFDGLSYDPMSYHTRPHFNDPWTPSNPGNTASQMYQPSLNSNLNLQSSGAKPSTVSMPYSTIPVTAPSISTGANYPNSIYTGSEMLNMSQDLLSPSRASYGTDHSYSSTSPSPSSYVPTQSPFASVAYSQTLQQQQAQQQQQQHHHQTQQEMDRHTTQPSLSSSYLSVPDDPLRRPTSIVDIDSRSTTSSHHSHPSFDDALDAGRGMVAMSQTDLTPRNIYGTRSQRGSADSYGFPSTASTHSTASSVSSANYPYFAPGSVDSSATDYSSASEAYEPLASRTLPRPTSVMGSGLPPAPQSMMGQFNSKVAPNAQKKHKCKVCEKRFTRPSSLQTHIYSHTGEKPFACDVEGCGRHFSVVSNLRRHKKVHRSENDHSSPE